MQIRRWVAQGFSGLDDFELIDDELGAPGPSEVTIEIEAAGVNPADLKHVTRGGDPGQLPLPVSYEVAGRITALGPDATIASGAGAVGDPVLASRMFGNLRLKFDKKPLKELEVTVSRGWHVQCAVHIEHAQGAGHPSVLTVNRAGARTNRRNSLPGRHPARPRSG